MGLNDLLQNWKLHLFLGLFSVILIYYVLPILIYLVFLLLAVVGGVVLALLHQPGPYKRRGVETFPEPPVLKIEGQLAKIKPYPPPTIKPKLLSPAVDTHIQEVLDLTLKHHVVPTYIKVGQDQEAFFRSVMPEIWNVLVILLHRMGQMDTMKLISQSVVQTLRNHFEQFRDIQYRDSLPSANFPNLSAFPYLESTEHELNFLRQVSEVLICVCLSRDLLECTPVRVLIREYLACHILQPTIEMVCDPDYINQKLLAHLIKREEAMERGKKTYAYKDYVDFISHINKCDDIDELQVLRQQIITDIIQAKAVYKMKNSHTTGLHGGRFPIPIPAEKVKILMGRDLELYITQLGTAKTVCERQLRKHGGEEYDEEDTPTTATYTLFQQSDIPLGIPFETIMKSEVTQSFLLQFLEECGFSHLLLFWISAERLIGSNLSSKSVCKDLKVLYNDFLSPIAIHTIHADPELVKPITLSLEGDSTLVSSCLPHVIQIQEIVYEELYEQFYQNFLKSDQYKMMMQQGSEGGEGAFPPLGSLSESGSHGLESLEDSRYKKKLNEMKVKLEEKDNELSLMPEEVQSSHSLAQRKKALQKDRFLLNEEIKKLEHYIDHTEEWFGTLGQWSVEIHSVDLSKDQRNDRNPLFIIVVHRPEVGKRKAFPLEVPGEISSSIDSNSDNLSVDSSQQSSLTFFTPEQTVQSLAYQHNQQHQQYMESNGGSVVDSEDTWSELSQESNEPALQSRSGWALGRHLSEFEQLHEKVSEICPNLYFPPLPKRLNPFQRPAAQSAYWQKYRLALQSYLCCVLKDERLKECEEVFNFVSSASDNMKKTNEPPPQVERKNRLLSRFSSMRESHHEEGSGSKESDSAAEYVYLLFSEVFELDQWSRVLRKQLVELVQLTYGKSIDRELQDTMNWVVSEPMLVFYLKTFRDAMWPEGKPATPAPTRSDEQKTQTKEDARVRFLKSSPQALQTILGHRNCQIGMQKIFEMLQDPRGNKQLFYALFEIVLYALVPELEKVEIDSDPENSNWKDY